MKSEGNPPPGRIEETVEFLRAAIEKAEQAVIESFLPEALSEDEIDALVKDSIESTGAESIRDMGKVMAIVKPQIQGRADVAAVSKLVKEQLAG